MTKRKITSKHRRLVATMVQGIRRVYAAATAEEIRAGRAWYAAAREFVHETAAETSTGPEIVAAVLAALSPRNPWEKNKRDTVALIRAFRAGGRAEDVKVSTFHANKFRAWRALESNSAAEVRTSRKTAAFIDNILRADSAAVTVDVHAVSIAYSERFVSAAQPKLTDRVYAEVQRAYAAAAARLDLRPHELQAITWLTWRRIHAIEKNGG